MVFPICCPSPEVSCPDQTRPSLVPWPHLILGSGGPTEFELEGSGVLEAFCPVPWELIGVRCIYISWVSKYLYIEHNFGAECVPTIYPHRTRHNLPQCRISSVHLSISTGADPRHILFHSLLCASPPLWPDQNPFNIIPFSSVFPDVPVLRTVIFFPSSSVSSLRPTITLPPPL